MDSRYRLHQVDLLNICKFVDGQALRCLLFGETNSLIGSDPFVTAVTESLRPVYAINNHIYGHTRTVEYGPTVLNMTLLLNSMVCLKIITIKKVCCT